LGRAAEVAAIANLRSSGSGSVAPVTIAVGGLREGGSSDPDGSVFGSKSSCIVTAS
jgi:hypothetical protein